MANYLERVASSAARRAAVAKPPVSGPPVLPPAGRDFFAADPFAIDEEQFVEALETPEISSESKEESENAATQNETLGVPVELKSKVRPAQERLSSEMPFTVQVPRTLRPGATPKVPPPIAQAEPPREQTPPRAAVTVGPEEVTVEPAPVVDQVQSSVKEPIIAEAETTTPLTPRPKPPVANREEQRRAPLPVHTATAPPDTTPIPRVDRMDAPAKYSAEPSPPPALPVQLPPAVDHSARQEQSRINIGSFEVLVNNHPRVPTPRPAPAPSRSESLNLEKRYLDRFRLRH